MKYYHLLALALTLAFTSCDKEKIVNEGDLPADASSFIATHYPDQTITRVIKDRDNTKITFDVYLNNGTKLEFSRSGNLKEIEGSEPIPNSVFPPLVLQYVQENYPAAFIRGWEKDDATSEARLSNGIELVFDKHGNFLRIDD
ncbi:MAG: PepSY-like domain-containing protein [Chitinophagaceae bacterium]|nr:PepSY-like domain-containing protein [Chitinophagaceae bacterium]